MQSWSKWWRDSLPLTVQLVRVQALPFAILFALTCGFDIWMEDALQAAEALDKSQHLEFQIPMALSDFLSGIVLFLILSWGIPKLRPMPRRFQTEPFQTPYLSSFAAEYLRMIAQVLMYGLLLVLPGIYRYCQLAFVPFIALFSREYREGQWDALKVSQELARPLLGRVFVALAAPLALGALFDLAPQMLEELHTLPLRVVSALVSDVIAVWGFALVYLLFESAMLKESL